MEKVTVELGDNFIIEGEMDDSGKITFSNNGKYFIAEKEDDLAKRILNFRTRQSITNLYKQFLVLVEDLQEEYDGNMSRLLEVLPESEIPKLLQAKFLDEAKFQYLRKKILSVGNDTIRNLESELDNYHILFNIESRDK